MFVSASQSQLAPGFNPLHKVSVPEMHLTTLATLQLLLLKITLQFITASQPAWLL